MIGAIAGDIIGSTYEFDEIKVVDFELFPEGARFTDDSVLTIALADALLQKKEIAAKLLEYANSYEGRGYGGRFAWWMRSSDPKPYNSFGNGSAMRVSPVGWFYQSLEDVLEGAKKSAEITHNHAEGIKGAQAVATAVFLARTNTSKEEIRSYIKETFGYDMDRSLNEIRPLYELDDTCQKTVPESIIAFLDSDNYEDAVRKAISLGGDADTMGCITGSIAEAFYKEIPTYILDETRKRLDEKLLKVVDDFEQNYS